MTMDARTRGRLLGLAASCAAVCAPALAMAAGGGGGGEHGHGFPWASFAASWVNFAIFLAIIWKFGMPSIQKFFAERRELLQANLDEARRLREEAQAQLEAYQTKLDALDEERDALLEEYTRQGERERDRIIEEANAQAEKMKADAERLLEQEVKKAIAMLEQKAVDEAVELARKIAGEQLEGRAAQDKLVDRYVGDLESLESLRR